MVQFESFGSASYSHSLVTMLVSLAVLTEYTNVTDTQRDTDPRHDGKGRAYA